MGFLWVSCKCWSSWRTGHQLAMAVIVMTTKRTRTHTRTHTHTHTHTSHTNHYVHFVDSTWLGQRQCGMGFSIRLQPSLSWLWQPDQLSVLQGVPPKWPRQYFSFATSQQDCLQLHRIQTDSRMCSVLSKMGIWGDMDWGWRSLCSLERVQCRKYSPDVRIMAT